MGKSYKKLTEPNKFKKNKPRNTTIKPQRQPSKKNPEGHSAQDSQDWFEGEWEESFERFYKKR
tara:strand:- start:400 stop:588 length:189 start_codon:yes stop_codon:yes gene_type:complete